jgi:hypothetical protein
MVIEIPCGDGVEDETNISQDHRRVIAKSGVLAPESSGDQIDL